MREELLPSLFPVSLTAGRHEPLDRPSCAVARICVSLAGGVVIKIVNSLEDCKRLHSPVFCPLLARSTLRSWNKENKKWRKCLSSSSPRTMKTSDCR